MITEDEYGLFPELPFTELPPFEAHTTCAQCEHIIAVHFSRSNLFFCTAQKGGEYGRKIKKSAPNCEMFVEGTGNIPHGDGYYGGHYSNGVSRGKANS